MSDFTNSPEILEGRVKTLHPKIHAGILNKREKKSHLKDLKDNGFENIDLVVVNFYPFENTLKKTKNHKKIIENIDVGGPTMVRSAAKNYNDVTVITSSDQYEELIEELKKFKGSTSLSFREKLSRIAFTETAYYDSVISDYFNKKTNTIFPKKKILHGNLREQLRYGENPHQAANLLTFSGLKNKNIANAEILQGKELSYNNIVDADAAWECVRAFDDPACVIVKHANPCGVAESENIYDAYDLAFKTDPTSAFGGIIALNRMLDAKTAKEINSRQFVEVILATDFEDGAILEFAKKKNVRVLKVDLKQDNPYPGVIKKVSGGILLQGDDTHLIQREDLKCVTKRQPTPKEIDDLMFAWRVAKFVKSNAIVYVRNRQTIGIGAGQMSRVISADIANLKAKEEGLEVKGAVMASDAFFPFRDGIDKAASSGIAAIIQPGGSIRDEEVIAAADENNIAMVYTGIRHFRH